MTPIPLGTLCLLVPPDEHAGMTCVTVSPEIVAPVEFPGVGVRWARVYAIDGKFGSLPPDWKWCAPRSHLLPLAPPGDPDEATRDTRTPSEVAA